MAPNSRIVKWLRSIYRGVLRRQWVAHYRHSAEFLSRAGARRRIRRLPVRHLDALEPRVLLSSTTFEDISLAAYTGNPLTTSDMRAAIVTGLTELKTQLTDLSGSNEFNTDIPGVLEFDGDFFIGGFTPPKAKNLLDLLGTVGGAGISSVFQNQVIDKISAIADGSTLAAFNIAAAGGIFLSDATFTVSIGNAQLVHLGGDLYELRFDVGLLVTDPSSDSLFFDLGRSADQFGIRDTQSNPYFPTWSNEINVSAGLSVTLTAGVALTITEGDFDGQGDAADTQVAVANDEQDFFIRDASLAATANIDTTGETHLNNSMQFGFLDVNMALESYVLDAQIQLAFNGGDTVFYAGLGSMTTTASVNGTIDADINVTVDTLADFADAFTDAPAPEFKLHFTGTPLGAAVSSIPGSGDKRTAPTITLNADAESYLLPFKNVDSGAIVGLLQAFANRLGSLSASSVLSLPLPFTEGKRLGELLNIGNIISNALIFNQLAPSLAAGTMLVDSKGNPQFSSAQSLAQRLADILPNWSLADVNPLFIRDENGGTARKIIFSVGVDIGESSFDPDFWAMLQATDPASAIDIGFNLDLGEIGGLHSDAFVKITPSGRAEFTFGVDLVAGGTNPIALVPPGIPSQLRGVVDSSGAVQTPANGQLTQTAAFKLTIGGGYGGVITVVLTPGDTAGNTSVQDLVDDLQAKVNAAITAINLQTEPLAGRMLVRVGSLADGRLTISSDVTSYLLIKVSSGDNGGLVNQLGFLNNQQAIGVSTPANYRLSGDADFTLRIGDDATHVAVHVAQADTLVNTTVEHLVEDINDALAVAGINDRVEAVRLGNTTGIMLRLKDPATDKFLQVVAANATVERDLGWASLQAAAELQVVARSELFVQADDLGPTDGMPGADVTFDVIIDGGAPVPVTVRVSALAANPNIPGDLGNPSNTGDNASLADLVSDINIALAVARLPDGRRLGEVLSAGLIDTDRDAENNPNGQALTPDTIVFRSSANIGSFQIITGANMDLIGFTADKTSARVGPDKSTGAISGDAVFRISLGSHPSFEVTVTKASTDDNAASPDTIAALVVDIQDAIDLATAGNPAVDGKIIVGRSGDRIVLATISVADQQIRISLDEETDAGQRARDELGLQDNYLARADEGVRFFVQDAGLTVDLSVGVEDAQASAHLGFVGIDVTDIDASVDLNMGLDLKNNESGESRIFLDELDGRLTEISITGDAALPANGQVGPGEEFSITVNGVTQAVVLGDTSGNLTAADLVKSVQAALDAVQGALGARVVASADKAGRLVLTVSALQARSLSVGNTAAAPGLGLTDSGPVYSFLDASASWSGSATFGGIQIPNAPLGLDNLGSFSIPIAVSNPLPGIPSLIPDLSFIPPALFDFVDLVFNHPDLADILDAIKGLSTFLSGAFNDLPFVGDKIPVINQSLADLLGVASSFKKIADSFAANPTSTIQGLENRIIEALSLPSADPDDLVRVTYDSSTHVLLLELTFDESFNRTMPIDFDLEDYAPGVPFNLKGNAALEVEGSASSKLAIGIDLTTPGNPDLFLKTDSTSFDLSFAARGNGLNFVASLGPAGLFINDGVLAIDADGQVGTTHDPMAFSITLSDADGVTDGRVSLADLGMIDVVASPFNGAMTATLPIFFPGDSDFVGNLGLAIPDMRQFLSGDTSGVTVDVPDLSAFLDNLNFNLLDNIPLLIDGVDFVFAQLQTLLDDHLGSLNIPLVGGGLNDASQFINDIRTDVFQGLRDKFNNAIQTSDQIITDGLDDILGTQLGILNTPITVNKSLTGSAADFVEWHFGIGDSYSVTLPFDLGLPVLGLSSPDGVTLTVNWQLLTGFGLDFENGFHFLIDEGGAPELTVDLSIDLPDQLIGNLLFLKVTISDNIVGPDAFAQFALDFSGSGDGKLGLGELPNMDITPSLTGGADVDVHLRAGINGGEVVSDKVISAIPSIVSTFKLQATFDLLAAAANDNNAFTLDYVAFEGIGLDLGSFFSDFLKPVVQGIQEITEPLQPFIDVFTTAIPVISDLAGQPVTLLDIAGLFGEVDPSMLEAVANIITLVNSIPDVPNDGSLIIPFGDVVLVNANPGLMSLSGTDLNLFDPKAFDEIRKANSDLSSFGHFGDALDAFNNGGGFDGALAGSGASSDVQSFTSGLNGQSFGDFIAFPFLNDPSQILGALFGRPFTLITLDLPPFSFGFTYSQFFPIIGPLGASITGGLSATFDFAFGYDSFGLQKFAEGDFKYPLDIFRGFYVSDTANADGTGADVNEVEISGSLVGSAELNLGVAKGSVGGGVKVTFGLNLNDPNNDGKIRIEELINNIRFAIPPYNPLGIFDLGIKVEAFMTWAVEVLFVFKASGQIGPSLPLLDLTIPLPHEPVLASEPSNGVLRLNIGPFAGDRLNGNVADGNETLTITQTGDGVFDVSDGTFTQTYSGIQRIEAKGGQGNDTLTFIGVTVPVLLDGGAGDDVFDWSQSSSPFTVTGGTGNDILIGGSGDDEIDGGAGNDVLLGGAGRDLILGGDGDDIISGDDDDDDILGGAGNDKLAGGLDDDFIDGGADDDEIHGDATFDSAGNYIAPADPAIGGNDILSGGNDKDRIYGDGGDDRIGGGAAADLIEGGLGTDTVYGDSTYDKDGNVKAPLPMTFGNDRIYGESEAAPLTGPGNDGGDTLYGEGGNDFIRGNSGNDFISGGDGADLLFGDQDDDHIEGGDGGDIAFGGAGHDTVLGQAGADILFGDDGLVVYFGYPDFSGYQGNQIVDGNRLIGDGDSTLVPAAAGFDVDPLSRDFIITDIRDTDGDDYVDGAAGNDIAFGGKGNDHVFGDGDPAAPGFDSVTSPAGRDVLFGDGGEVRLFDRIMTRANTVDPDKGGDDFLFGNNGDDIAFGGFGADLIHGGHGAAFATTGSDKDVLIGDNGQVDFVNGKISVIKTTDPTNADGGIDTIHGNEDDDVILGGVAGDVLNGNQGNDIILGDEGQLDYNLGGPDFDGDIATLDRIQTTFFDLGSDDILSGNDGHDTLLGGTGGDTIHGNAGHDIAIGDQGRVTFFAGNVTVILTTDTSDADGGVDFIFGHEGNDIALGGVLGDFIDGNDGDDILLGDEGQVIFNLNGPDGDGDPLTIDVIETLQPTLGGSDIIQGNAGGDIAFGGAAGDFVYGDADNPVAALDGNDILFGDGGKVSLLNGIIHRIESNATDQGGNDYIEGNAGDDTMIGGAFSDELHGDAGDAADINALLDGNDIMLGDNGLLNWLYQGTPGLLIEGNFVFDNSIATLDLVMTTAPTHGADDILFGNAGDDLIMGGTASDLLVGDNTKGAPGELHLGPASTRPGSDLLMGDHGRYYPQHSFLSDFYSRNFFAIDIGLLDGGAGDWIFGNEEDDVLMGQQGDDLMFGGDGDDDMIGGHNVSTLTGVETAIDEFEKPWGAPGYNSVNDLMDGGNGHDVMAGDNAMIWRNGDALQANDLRLRFRTLNGTLLYTADGLPNITAGGHNDPRVTTSRSVILLDHTTAIQSADATSTTGARYGNDILAGNAGDDSLFGQLGADLLLGDSAINITTFTVEIFEGVSGGIVTDGHDYIEGNGGSDMIIGGLGQDDLIGGSSEFFGLTTAAQRPDVGDTLFGGAANPQRVARHAFTGDVTGDDVVFGSGLVNRHALDSDYILGDNGNIYRIVTDVGGGTAFVEFNYDQSSQYEDRGDIRIVVRAHAKLDYSPIESVNTSIGGIDVIHGESGDDFIHGMTGDDFLYGDAENDEMFGERGHDWMSGGTGDDAMLGDNGLVLTRRNALTEPLYGVTTVTSQYFLTEPGGFLVYLIDQDGKLKYVVDLETFDQGGHDVMYGGLGDDSMHGGEGNDGMSGAEALPEFYNNPANTPRVEVGDLPEDRFNEIRIIPRDGNGVVRVGFYDYTNALQKLDNHFLNFENNLSLQTTLGDHYDYIAQDGRDYLFGDWGDDWLAGGTGRDHLYGGMGNDILNLDDDLETNGGLNDAPDNGNLIPGEPGALATVYDNSDFSYGGGGRDLSIGNTAADRAEDWVGEFNSYQVPYAAFGNGSVERQVPPHTYDFFYKMSASDGADQTRVGNLAVPNGAVGTSARNGEPYGELGLITQKDKLKPFNWNSQNGPPADKQPGQTPGTLFDTRGDGLNGGPTNTSATTSPTVVVDIPLEDVIKISFSYWASIISGESGVTFDLAYSDDPVLNGQALTHGLLLETLYLFGEFRWIIVPL